MCETSTVAKKALVIALTLFWEDLAHFLFLYNRIWRGGGGEVHCHLGDIFANLQVSQHDD